MDDFTILTEEDKNSISYVACIAGMSVAGMAVGRVLGLQGVLAGGIGGAAWGLLTCRQLLEPIKKKLFSSSSRLADYELIAILQTVKMQQPFISKDEAMSLFAEIRQEISGQPSKYKDAVST